jgi:hypothetical protein
VRFGLKNDRYHHDRFCHWRVYRLWHGHGSFRFTLILDKKMNAYEMADLMVQFDSGRIWEHAEEIAKMLRMQADEIKALREQLVEAQL